MKPAMRSVGIDHGGWHRLRHTRATRLVEAGARPDQVQRQLGHHDLAFTMRTYLHAADDDMADPDALWPEANVEDDNEQPEEMGDALGLVGEA